MSSRREQVEAAYVDLLQSTSVAQHLFVEGWRRQLVLPHVTVVPAGFRKGVRLLVVGQMAAVTNPRREKLRPTFDKMLRAPRSDRSVARALYSQLQKYWEGVYKDERDYWTTDHKRKEFQRWWQAYIRLAAGVAGERLPQRFGRNEAAKFAPIAFDRVAWANIVKVDFGNANYIDEEDRRWHRRQGGLQILREEIRMLKPDAVVFAVGPAFKGYIPSALPGASFSPAPSSLPGELVRLPEHLDVPAVACWHFERLTHAQIDALARWVRRAGAR